MTGGSTYTGVLGIVEQSISLSAGVVVPLIDCQVSFVILETYLQIFLFFSPSIFLILKDFAPIVNKAVTS